MITDARLDGYFSQGLCGEAGYFDEDDLHICGRYGSVRGVVGMAFTNVAMKEEVGATRRRLLIIARDVAHGNHPSKAVLKKVGYGPIDAAQIEFRRLVRFLTGAT